MKKLLISTLSLFCSGLYAQQAHVGSLETVSEQAGSSLTGNPKKPSYWYEKAQMSQNAGDDVAAHNFYRHAITATTQSIDEQQIREMAVERRLDAIGTEDKERRHNYSRKQLDLINEEYDLLSLALATCAKKLQTIHTSQSYYDSNNKLQTLVLTKADLKALDPKKYLSVLARTDDVQVLRK